MHRAARMLVALAAGAILPVALLAQAPKGATAKCKDGTYSTSNSKQGMCSSHGGVAQLLPARRASRARSTAKPAATPARHVTPRSSRTKAAPATRSTAKTRRAAAAPSTREAPPPARPVAAAERVPTGAAPAGAPAGATAMCKDGTYSTSKLHTGACSHHGGVKEWLQGTR